MTPEQMTNDLILGGWIPVRYERNSGSVWVGVYHEDHGLLYRETAPIAYSPHAIHVPPWPWPETLSAPKQEYIQQFKCRWVDVEKYLPELYAKAKGVVP